MAEYLAPGVYIEEVSFRSKTIEGVSTSTAGFVGPTRFGPTKGEPELVTSLADFERIYGGLDQLRFGGSDSSSTHNYLAHGVRAFFEEGGKRLYVSRVYSPNEGDGEDSDDGEDGDDGDDGESGSNGQASIINNQVIDDPAPTNEITLTARFPGRAGNMRITFVPQLSRNLLVSDPVTNERVVRRIQENDTVLVTSTGDPPTDLYDVVRSADGDNLELRPRDSDGTENLQIDDGSLQEVRILTVDVTIERPIIRPKRPRQRYAIAEVLQGFSFHPQHANALRSYFTDNPPSRGLALSVPFEMTSLDSGAQMAEALLGQAVINALANQDATASDRQRVYRLTDGSDGLLPTADVYRGDSSTGLKSGLAAFEDIEDISIVAAPGYSADYTMGDQGQIETIQAHLINHCHRMRYRVAVLDSPDQQILGGVRNYRGKIDSTHAALYYPWVRILDPITENEINLPPSGFVAGIYARNDVENGVHKAPANEVVRLSIGFEYMLNKAQQDVLNPEGINCFRFFEGRGYRLWGARTISSDPEWKYLNVRRYFAYLERSIERGTQWAVFENNNTPLWANIRRTIEDFLFNEWRSGRLMGDQPEEAYFVRCDRSTMTQNDIDNGRLICLIGVSPVRPAEFVIFRIGQWTADRR